MSTNDVIIKLKAKLKCLEHSTSPTSLCNDIKCDSCSLNYEQGNIGEQKECLRAAIYALEFYKNKWGENNG